MVIEWLNAKGDVSFLKNQSSPLTLQDENRRIFKINNSISVNEAIILAAGFGNRIRELSGKIPKPLLKVGTKSLLQHNIEQLIKAKISIIYIVTGYRSKLIEDHVAKLQKILPVQLFLVHNSHPHLGNGKSLMAAKNFIKSPYCLLTMVDNFPDYNIFVRAKEAVGAISKINGMGLCIDHYPKYNFQINDATKVSTKNERIINIGKKIERYDGIDMGVFLINMRELKKLNIEKRRLKLTITDIMKYWIEEAKRPFISIDCSGLFWTDIDTKVDLKLTQEVIPKIPVDYKLVGSHG